MERCGSPGVSIMFEVEEGRFIWLTRAATWVPVRAVSVPVSSVSILSVGRQAQGFTPGVVGGRLYVPQCDADRLQRDARGRSDVLLTATWLRDPSGHRGCLPD